MLMRTKKPIIGLLGGPGSGKSTVAAGLAKLGGKVIDADALAKEALEQPETVSTLRSWWGDGVVDGAGKPDRRAIGEIVFGDKGQRQRLESLVHPWVNRHRQELRKKYGGDPNVKVVVDDTPLLLEQGLAEDGDVLVFVDAPRSQRLARLADSRGWDAVELGRRENHQAPLDIKRARADYVLDNSDGADLSGQLRRLLETILHERV